MMFDTHDSDSLVLSDIRELLHIIAKATHLPQTQAFELRRMKKGETNDAATGVPFRTPGTGGTGVGT